MEEAAMSGKVGQRSVKAIEITQLYDENFMASMDGRTLVARELRDRLHALAADLGGWMSLSYQERSLCRRLIHLERLVEQKELKLATGGRFRPMDENVYFNSINSLSGLLSKIGLKRRVKILALGDYLAEKAKASKPCPVKVKEPEL
jgi:hypothetical protein